MIDQSGSRSPRQGLHVDALAFLGLVCLSQAAFAVGGPATPGKPHSTQPPLEVRRRVAEEFGACIVSHRGLHGQAVRFVLSGKESDGEMLSIGNCVAKAVAEANFHGRSQWNFSTAATRSFVADGLVRSDFPEKGPTDFSTVPPLGPAPPDKDETPAAAMARSLADKLGECAVRVSPEGIRRLAQTPAASDEETNELRELVPTFAQCLSPGQKLEFPVNVLRDSSVLAYARLAYTLAASGSGRKGGH